MNKKSGCRLTTNVFSAAVNAESHSRGLWLRFGPKSSFNSIHTGKKSIAKPSTASDGRFVICSQKPLTDEHSHKTNIPIWFKSHRALFGEAVVFRFVQDCFGFCKEWHGTVFLQTPVFIPYSYFYYLSCSGCSRSVSVVCVCHWAWPLVFLSPAW